MTYDFSDAERIGFELAVQECYGQDVDLSGTARSKHHKEFNRTVSEVYRKYPKAARWLKWHLNPSRAKYFFPATSSYENITLSKDTNAQESLGAVFRRSAPKPKPSIGGVLDHSYRFTTLIEQEYTMVSDGENDRKTRAREPPEDSETEVPENSEPECPDHPEAENRESEFEIDWNTFGIP
ncbi:hypothetical protein BGZ65_008420 [Modicella reniformis]|uniref:Uncharacterized protein n=1 Tax=Modicella reniformis TaxID=1440133 RepID=A0A9P6IJY2_9FUNG|nr:hypothetical protein BGZ65_008420 [Modicella reniformis]